MAQTIKRASEEAGSNAQLPNPANPMGVAEEAGQRITRQGADCGKRGEKMHELTIKSSNGRTRLFLDDFELQSVTGYELKSNRPSEAELMLKLIVSNTQVLSDDSSNDLGGDTR